VSNSNRGEHINQKPGADSRPGTLSEFQFRESTESGRFVKASLSGWGRLKSTLAVEPPGPSRHIALLRFW
jgi:hypothetical protein